MDYRQLTPKDGEALLQLMLTLDNETAFMLYEPGERNTTAEEMAHRIKRITESGGVVFGCLEGEALVGFVTADRGKPNRIHHSAYIVTGVRQAWSGKGIATWLFHMVDEWAEHVGITKLELTVMCHNERAFNLYQRLGYDVEGTKKRSVSIQGDYYDEYYMGKCL